MNKTIAYLRVSTDGQECHSQKYEILDYANKNDIHINEFIELKVSSRRSNKERLIDELMEKLETNDCLIVSELSRLGRSMSQIITIMDELIKKQIKVIIIKQNMIINGKKDIQTTVLISVFSLLADIERQLISERTKAGLVAARAKGKLLGRPKGNGKSKLNGKESEIQELLNKGVSRASIAKIMGVSWPAANHFIKTRKLA